MRSGFARLHPLVDLTFFVLVLAFAMFLSHPAVQLAGLVCAALFALRCTGRGFGRRMAMLLPLMLLAAVVNPLVSHQGVTVLFRFPSGNACTLESVLYGISAAVRLGTAVLWFMGWNAVMTSDKFVYLFGRILPSLSLTLSMGLRFVPRLLRRTREVAQAQKLARPAERGWLAGIRRAGRVVSIVVTWALENALDTADSMKSRGYGLPKRTAFSLFRFTLRDGICLGVLATLGGIVLAGSLTGGLKWWYYPAPGGAAGVQAAVWAAAITQQAAIAQNIYAKEAGQKRATRRRPGALPIRRRRSLPCRTSRFPWRRASSSRLLARPAAANRRCCAR